MHDLIHNPRLKSWAMDYKYDNNRLLVNLLLRKLFNKVHLKFQ